MRINKPIEVNNELVYTNENNTFLNLNFSVFNLKEKNEKKLEKKPEHEGIILLLFGDISLFNEKNKLIANFKRKSVFDEPSLLLSFPKETFILIKANKQSSFIYANIKNKNIFPLKIFNQENIKIAGIDSNKFGGKATRNIIEIFSSKSFPESNFSVGEVISGPGCWSSWPPHKHQQPEIYYFLFDKKDGFGACYVNNEAFMVRNGDAVAIPGNLFHPTSSAPGFCMYFAWIIPSYPKPWLSRDFSEKYLWQFDTNDYPNPKWGKWNQKKEK